MSLVILVVLLLDVSGSMALGSRIEALNSNVRSLLALLRAPVPTDTPPTPYWVAIAAFGDEPLWIVDVPTPADEVLWAELVPWSRQRANFDRALAEAEQLVTRQVPAQFHDALVVLVTDAAASAAIAHGQSDVQRVTLLVGASDADAQDGIGPQAIVELAKSLRA